MLSDSVKYTFSVIMMHINQWLLRGRMREGVVKDRHSKGQNNEK